MNTTYLHTQQALPRVDVRGSDVAGYGVFAGENMMAGSYVMPLTGKKMARGDFDETDYSLAVLQIGKDMFLMAQGGADDYINHSCDPNLVFSADGLSYMALKDIKAGDELVLDYSTSEDDSRWTMMCRCGSAKCRGLVTGFGLLSPREQKRLYPHALPYIRAQYKDKVA